MNPRKAQIIEKLCELQAEVCEAVFPDYEQANDCFCHKTHQKEDNFFQSSGQAVDFIIEATRKALKEHNRKRLLSDNRVLVGHIEKENENASSS